MVNWETTAETIAWIFKISLILYHKRLEKSFRYVEMQSEYSSKCMKILQYRFQLGVDTLDLSLRMGMHSHLVMIAITSLVRDGTIIT